MRDRQLLGPGVGTDAGPVKHRQRVEQLPVAHHATQHFPTLREAALHETGEVGKVVERDVLNRSRPQREHD